MIMTLQTEYKDIKEKSSKSLKLNELAKEAALDRLNGKTNTTFSEIYWKTELIQTSLFDCLMVKHHWGPKLVSS